MSELNQLRHIPSRKFDVSFKSDQKIREFPNISWVPKFSGGKVSFGIGTVNGFIASNWNEEFDKPDDKIRYVKIKVNSTIEGIQSVELLFEPKPEINNPFKKEIPPASFTFILGTVRGVTYSMAFTGPINVTPQLMFKIPKNSAPTPGQSPYDNYWGWTIQ